jgi:hypothetical protein
MGSRTYHHLMLNITMLVRNWTSKKQLKFEEKKKEKKKKTLPPTSQIFFHVTLGIPLNK